jgi:succinate dehydrogenase / fumarate reductase flavoprotein subunit
MGTVFSRLENGKIAQRPFGGAGFPRTCYAADRTGHNLLHTLYEQVKAKNLKIYEEFFVTSLVVENKKCIGCCALEISTGILHGFSSKATLLATGGYGRIYSRSTNALINTGDGAALALKAGAPLKDMEFVQFHPTTLYGTNILMTEGARGEGGYLFNSKNERFMKDYAAKAMELAPRDIVARAIQKEIDEGKGFENEYVNLDLTHLGAQKIKERLPGIRLISMDFAGVDPIEKPIPVQPGQHYSMGGVDANNDCATPIAGLFAAGECACISMHGANRLGGNSLLETVVFGRIAGRSMTSYAQNIDLNYESTITNAVENETRWIQSILSRDAQGKMSDVRNGLKKTMFNHFGVFRKEESMKAGLTKLEDLKKRINNISISDKGKVFNQSLISYFELENMVLVAEAVAKGALKRKESRGSHFRSDYPKRDDENFLKHTMAYLQNGFLEIEYSPVRLGKYPVKERVY